MKRLVAVFVLVFACDLIAMPARGQDEGPLLGKVQVCLAVEERLPPGIKKVDLDESVKQIRAHLKGLKWAEPTDKPEEADIVVTILGPRHDPDKGNVLRYTLAIGDEYKVQDDFTFASGTELNSGDRSLGSDMRATVFAGTRKFSWGELGRQFANSIDAYAKSKYWRLMERRAKVQP